MVCTHVVDFKTELSWFSGVHHCRSSRGVPTLSHSRAVAVNQDFLLTFEPDGTRSKELSIRFERHFHGPMGVVYVVWLISDRQHLDVIDDLVDCLPTSNYK